MQFSCLNNSRFRQHLVAWNHLWYVNPLKSYKTQTVRLFWAKFQMILPPYQLLQFDHLSWETSHSPMRLWSFSRIPFWCPIYRDIEREWGIETIFLQSLRWYADPVKCSNFRIWQLQLCSISPDHSQVCRANSKVTIFHPEDCILHTWITQRKNIINEQLNSVSNFSLKVGLHWPKKKSVSLLKMESLFSGPFGPTSRKNLSLLINKRNSGTWWCTFRCNVN